MKNEAGATLSVWTKRLLVTVAVIAMSGPTVVGVLTAPILSAQAAATTGNRPAFEVASVKRNASGDANVEDVFLPGGRYRATNVTVRYLIRAAYRLQDFQIVDGPDWITSERFDIVAKAAHDLPPPRSPDIFFEGSLMLQTLLAERFNVIVHYETRDLPVYGLVMARNDGRMGPRLRRPETDCRTFDFRKSPTPPPGGFCGGIRSGPSNFIGKGATMRQLALNLSPRVGRIVLDRTGLSGAFDLDLEWAPNSPAVASPEAALTGGAAPADLGLSIFTAVQEQLGLKLDSQRGPVDVLVIDRAERPTPD